MLLMHKMLSETKVVQRYGEYLLFIYLLQSPWLQIHCGGRKKGLYISISRAEMLFFFFSFVKLIPKLIQLTLLFCWNLHLQVKKSLNLSFLNVIVAGARKISILAKKSSERQLPVHRDSYYSGVSVVTLLRF